MGYTGGSVRGMQIMAERKGLRGGTWRVGFVAAAMVAALQLAACQTTPDNGFAPIDAAQGSSENISSLTGERKAPHPPQPPY